MITRHNVKSCCGSSGMIFEMDRPIRRSQMNVFKQADYHIPANYEEAGLFYVQKQFLIATASFGANRINIRCNGANCSELLDQFALDLERAINS